MVFSSTASCHAAVTVQSLLLNVAFADASAAMCLARAGEPGTFLLRSHPTDQSKVRSSYDLTFAWSPTLNFTSQIRLCVLIKRAPAQILSIVLQMECLAGCSDVLIELPGATAPFAIRHCSGHGSPFLAASPLACPHSSWRYGA